MMAGAAVRTIGRPIAAGQTGELLGQDKQAVLATISPTISPPPVPGVETVRLRVSKAYLDALTLTFFSTMRNKIQWK
jgi:hypothetical protein